MDDVDPIVDGPDVYSTCDRGRELEPEIDRSVRSPLAAQSDHLD